MDALLKDAIIDLAIAVVLSTIIIYWAASSLNKDAAASKSQTGKAEHEFGWWSIITSWIILVGIIFCSIFFPSNRYI